jgi:hypothetical protein
MRDRRWDFLYERQKQPVKQVLLDRFAEELAGELGRWPPPAEWVSKELRSRYAAGLRAPPGDDGIRFALRLAGLELVREFEVIDRLMGSEALHHWRGADEEAAGHLLVRFVTERCLALKEEVEGARITRDDLARAIASVEKRFFASRADAPGSAGS